MQVRTPKISGFTQAVLPDLRSAQGGHGVVQHLVPDLLSLQSPQVWGKTGQWWRCAASPSEGPWQHRVPSRRAVLLRKLWDHGYSAGQESSSQFLAPAVFPTLGSTSHQNPTHLDITSVPVPSSLAAHGHTSHHLLRPSSIWKSGDRDAIRATATTSSLHMA